MIGGVGADVYLNPDTVDRIVEIPVDPFGHDDLVRSERSFSLAGIAYVENLTLLGTAALNGTGNTLDNVITGNGGHSTLSGAEGNDILVAGSAATTLIGGVGDDTYSLRGAPGAASVVIEALGEGNDTVEVDRSFSIAARPELENIVAGLFGGSTTSNDLVLTGNDGDNVLQGGNGDDTLIGGGGDDTLYATGMNGTRIGGAGDDTYYYRFGTIVEEAGGGIDTILEAGPVDLSELPNVENVTLTEATQVTVTGNALANLLVSVEGYNTLDGAAGDDTLDGGSGNDRLEGGAGNDVYRAARAGAGTDTIGGFDAGQDRFDLSGGHFLSLSEAGGATILRHGGGFIVVEDTVGLTLAQWNDLLVP